MREIKFKAKHNGKWIFGFVQFRKKTDDAVMWIENEDGLFTWLHVDKYTVCQFTGLQDKNGVDIYEGDIYEIHKSKYFIFFYNGSFTGGKSIDKSTPMNWAAEYDDENEPTDDLCLAHNFLNNMAVTGNIHD